MVLNVDMIGKLEMCLIQCFSHVVYIIIFIEIQVFMFQLSDL